MEKGCGDVKYHSQKSELEVVFRYHTVNNTITMSLSDVALCQQLICELLSFTVVFPSVTIETEDTTVRCIVIPSFY